MTDFFRTHIGQNAKSRLAKVLDKGWLNEGEQVRRFEMKLNVLLDLPNVLTTNSCSSSLLLCLLDVEVKDQEVILPSQTFVATGMAILMAGGKPVFADIDPNTGNLCPVAFENAITEKTKAVISVLWAGNPCDPQISEIARKYNIKVIQDAAHGLGSTMNNHSVAHFADYTCYSFQSIKHLTTGDGGAISSPNALQNIRKMKWFGIDRSNIKRDELGGRIPNIDTMGFKFHMNDLAAALGLSNLLGYRNRLKRRNAIAKIYEDKLNMDGILLLQKPKNSVSANWMFTFRAKSRNNLALKLKQSGIPCSTVDYGIHRNPVFGTIPYLAGQELFDQTQLSLPVHEEVTAEFAERITDVIRKGW